MLAVNGINAENMTEYLQAGAYGVGVGSGIADKKKIAAGDFAGITALAKAYTEKL
jgi:2-dehydro-3-deoxyphosphogluconate aldolase/(4S)-4-hydroxy-2-oxoglutarate aldolase